MKTTVKLVTMIVSSVLLTIVWIGQLHAAPTNCGGVANVTIETNRDTDEIYTDIQTALNDYASHLYGDRYELCFEFEFAGNPGDYYYHVDMDTHVLEFTSSSLPGDVVIEGLKLKQVDALSKPLLTIKADPSKKVIIQDLVAKNETAPVDSMTALMVDGSYIDLINAKIDGAQSGDCVIFENVNGSSVVRGIIEKCTTGITIQDSSNIIIGAINKNDFTDMAVAIKDNEVGLRVDSTDPLAYLSNYNSWPYTSFSGNTANAIDLVAGNEYLLPPEIEKVEGKTVACEDDGTGKMIRKLKFKPMGQEGFITFYKRGPATPPQGAEYVNMCQVDIDGNCTLGAFLPPVIIPPEECGLANTYLTGIFTGINGSSTGFSNKISLGDHVVFVTGGLPMPTSDPEGASADGGGTPGDSGEVTETGTELVDEEAVTLADAPSGAPITAVGMKGCGSSLIPYEANNTIAPALGLWWIIFIVGLKVVTHLAKVLATRPRRRRSKRRR